MSFSTIPKWELYRANYDTDYTNFKKCDGPLLPAFVKSHIYDTYRNHLKVYTDGSVLDNRLSGSAFIIPSLKIEKSYHLGKNFSIFTAELVAIIMALNCLLDFPFCVFQILFCVDSKSVLQALKLSNTKVRNELIQEIYQLIHFLYIRGSQVDFCWVPSHCGLSANERVDQLAKKAAITEKGLIKINLPLS